MRDRLLEKSTTEGTVVVQPVPRRIAEAGPVGDTAAGLELIGESFQLVPGRDRAQRWQQRIGSASAGPDISYSTGMASRATQANVIGPVDRELGSATAATRPDMRGSARPIGLIRDC